MTIQLRTYTINRGDLDTWVAEWQEKIKPLRVKFGFDILGAWTIPETSQFVWILSYKGPDTWETADKAFHASEDRKAMDPDPARNIARIEHFFLIPV